MRQEGLFTGCVRARHQAIPEPDFRIVSIPKRLSSVHTRVFTVVYWTPACGLSWNQHPDGVNWNSLLGQPA
jgi:hypothetical protein